ncbi:DENN domain-containing protein 11-like [Styela clava]
MDDIEDTTPLISNQDDLQSPNSQIRELFQQQRRRKVIGNDAILSPDIINISESNCLDGLEADPPDNIISVFVVAFDTKCGNIIEWCLPSDFDLSTVEFKAMPSGAHTVNSDFLYFRKDNMYGLSCFEKMQVDSTEERGVRMKSVGVLATTYTALHKYSQFLEVQVRHQLQTPGDYKQLIAFYEDKKGLIPPSFPIHEGIVSNFPSSGDQLGLPEMTIIHPVGCFLHFIRFFGESVFVLWKLALLQKRILFFSPPPIGVVCYRVYCTSCLAKQIFTKQTRKLTKPYFYVNIADIEQLENEMSYIACTTEKIFCEKPHLYDVYVDNRVIKSVSPALKSVLKVNRCDEEKYQQLLTLRQEHVYLDGIGEAEHHNEEQMFASFFMEQNNRIFQTLFDISTSDNKTLTTEHMRAMGLDPCSDRQFITLLLETYNIDALMVVDNPCCPV